jgi:hypothetical protein
MYRIIWYGNHTYDIVAYRWLAGQAHPLRCSLQTFPNHKLCLHAYTMVKSGRYGLHSLHYPQSLQSARRKVMLMSTRKLLILRKKPENCLCTVICTDLTCGICELHSEFTGQFQVDLLKVFTLRMPSSVMWRRVVLVRADVSQE